MQPKSSSKGGKEYEKVELDTWIKGVIEDVEHDENHDTKFKDPNTGKSRIIDAVRFKFKLEGYEYPHRSSWMTLTYFEKGNLFNVYLSQLVEGANPDMEFDLSAVKGMLVKTMWTEKKGFQKIQMIRPAGGKIPLGAQERLPVDEPPEMVGPDPDSESAHDDSELPFSED